MEKSSCTSCKHKINSTASKRHPNKCCSCNDEGELNLLQQIINYSGLNSGKGQIEFMVDSIVGSAEEVGLALAAKKVYDIKLHELISKGLSKHAHKLALRKSLKVMKGKPVWSKFSKSNKIKWKSSFAGKLASKTGKRVLKGAGLAVQGVIGLNDFGRAYNSGNATAMTRSTASTVTGLGGGIAGAEWGAAIGTALGPVGIFVGGVLGGIFGGLGASMITEKTVDFVAEEIIEADYICDECLNSDDNKCWW